MKLRLVALLGCIAAPAFAQEPLSPADEAAAFTAAGFVKQGGHWSACPDDVTDSYTPGSIQTIGDLNGDGLPEAATSEGSTFCYGAAGDGWALVSKQADGSWKLMNSGAGVPIFLTTRGVDDWPDIEVGGPGFCFPVQRWNGSEYVLNRHEYEGVSCLP